MSASCTYNYSEKKSERPPYLAAIYERNNGTERELSYIPCPSGIVAIHEKMNGAENIYYIHLDHLGSITEVTDQQRILQQRITYNAWGVRDLVYNNSNSGFTRFMFDRGFTGHEHLDEFALINMNGRMYDPVLGRMLSPDNYVQNATNTQGFNRYSYAFNNPLIYTDPSGELYLIDDLIVGGVGFAFGYVSYGITHGDWGWKAVGAGGIGAGVALLSYYTAGGFMDNSIPAIFPSNLSNLKFTFVPTVSAIDIAQNQWYNGNFSYFNENGTNNAFNIITQGITPFDDIYINNNNDFHTDQEVQLTNGIENDEIMYINMYMQNRYIENDRDFEAAQTLTVGNNITGIEGAEFNSNDDPHIKYVESGNFVIKSGTNVNFKAGHEITLEPGFETEPGATFVAETGDICTSNKSFNVNISTPVIVGNLKICGENTYTVENADNNVFEWKLSGENIFITTFGNEFTTPATLKMGQYTIYCTFIGPHGEATITKLINVVCKHELKNNTKDKVTVNNIEMAVYPNPSKDIFYISINSNEIKNFPIQISIYDMLSKLVYSDKIILNKRIVINLTDKPSGIYFIILRFNNIEFTTKLIKQ